MLLAFVGWIGITAFINDTNAAWVYVQPTSKDIKLKFEKSYVLSRLAEEWFLDEAMYTYFWDGYSDIYKVYMSYDYLNKTKAYDKLIQVKREALEALKTKTIGDLSQITIDRNYELPTKLKANKLTWFPKDLTDDKNFSFMIDWIKNDKRTVANAKEIGTRIGVDYRLVLSSILTEQVRYALTERGEMKKFLQKTPMLLYLTQFSYWVGWVKSFTAEKIRDDASTYWYWKELSVHKDTSGETAWKSVLIDKYWQVAYPSYLIKNIITRWSKAGFDISWNPGVIITLYNFWNVAKKEPNKNPKVGWADISVKWQTYNFWGLGEWFFWWMKIYKKI